MSQKGSEVLKDQAFSSIEERVEHLRRECARLRAEKESWRSKFDRAESERQFAQGRLDNQGNLKRQEQADLQRHKTALEKAMVECEQAIGHLTDGGNGSKHDPSWIRPVNMTKPEMVNACQQAYHRIHEALRHINDVLGGEQTTKQP